MRDLARGSLATGLTLARHVLRYVTYQIAPRR